MVEKHFISDNCFINKTITVVFLSLFCLIILSVVSSVSAANVNSGPNAGSEIQDLISNSNENEIVLNSGDYSNILNLNITRNITIKGNGQVNIIGPGNGILFNIKSVNVKIINLNISGYQTAIKSNVGGVSVENSNISTSDVSIHFAGPNLTDIYLENNNIISSVSNKKTGAIYVNSSEKSTVNVYLKNNTITANGLRDSIGVRIDAFNCDDTLVFENNNITGIVGVYIYGQYGRNNFTFINNNVKGNNVNGEFMDIANCDDGFNFEILYGKNNIIFTGNNVTSKLDAVFLSLFGSNSNITFNRNNLKGGENGLSISTYMVNLILTIDNNNITGSAVYGIWISSAWNDITLNFTNNNITGYLTGVSMDSAGSNIIANFNNNNITGIYDYGIDWWTPSSNITINFTKNNITGQGGVYMEIDCGNNTITFTNNKIIGKNWHGIYLYADDSNNNITFSNNNIEAECYGVYMYAPDSNNNISLNGDNIKGKWHSVSLDVFHSTNNITFKNTHIIGSLDGVSLNADKSDNTITFTNNNIKGEEWEGVSLSASNSKNTIIFTNNNIKGKETGVSLNIYGDKNIVTFTNNNIKGEETGVNLYVYGINNNVTFVGNTITGNDYAIAINSWYIFNGLFLLNNTITSNNVCLYFALNGGTVLSDVLVKGNTIIANNVAIKFTENSPSFVNVTVNYNRILGKIGLDYTAVSNDKGSNFDYNWWGINDITNKVIGFNTNNHYILSFTNLTSLDNVYVGDKLNFALLVLNTTLTNEGVENLPYFVINGTFNGVDFNSSYDDRFMYQFTVTEEGLQYLEATLDEQYIDLSFEAFIPEVETEDPNSNTNDSDNETDDTGSFTEEGKNKEANKNNSGHLKDCVKNSVCDVLNANASTKPTGVPIAILLILTIFGLIAYRRNL